MSVESKSLILSVLYDNREEFKKQEITNVVRGEDTKYILKQLLDLQEFISHGDVMTSIRALFSFYSAIVCFDESYDGE